MFGLLDDAAVIDRLGALSREENAACGRRLAWMGELYARRAPEDDVERINWAIDGHANVVAEISAAVNISRAGRQDSCNSRSRCANGCPRCWKSSKPGRLITGWWRR